MNDNKDYFIEKYAKVLVNLLDISPGKNPLEEAQKLITTLRHMEMTVRLDERAKIAKTALNMLKTGWEDHGTKYSLALHHLIERL